MMETARTDTNVEVACDSGGFVFDHVDNFYIRLPIYFFTDIDYNYFSDYPNSIRVIGELNTRKWLSELNQNHDSMQSTIERNHIRLAKNRILKLQGKKLFFSKSRQNSKISREKNFVNTSKCKKYYR